MSVVSKYHSHALKLPLRTNAPSRRQFLQTIGPGLILIQTAVSSLASITLQEPIERGLFSDKDLGWAREELLKLVNEERAGENLSPLQLDELASRVASEHAADMLQNDFLAHWSSDGLKPYQRYSFAGGVDAVQENVSAARNIASVTPLRVFSDLKDMHVRMFSEKPPLDGHRRAIVASQNTHVGFGIALKGRNLRLAELYLARYLELKPFPKTAKPKASVNLSGKLLSPKYALHEVDVFFEPLPQRPDPDWLRTPRAYSLPEDYESLRPKAPFGTTYRDGKSGDYESDREGRFQVPVRFKKDTPGIYTMVFWIKRFIEDKKFPAAQICIRCE
jgi:uncharacterized protein YkwD